MIIEDRNLSTLKMNEEGVTIWMKTKKQKREKRSVWQVTMQFFIRKLKVGRIFELKKLKVNF